MWCRTACPKTMSKLASSKGSSSASASSVPTCSPSCWALARSAFSMPGEMSVAVARSSSPACIRLSVKYPVPAPISSPSPNGCAGSVPSALRILASTCSWPVSPKSMPHLES